MLSMFCNTAQRIIASGAWSIVVFASVLFLAACGGGGGGIGISPPDSPVATAPQPGQPQPTPRAEKVAFGAVVSSGGNEASMVVSLDAVAGNDESYVVLRQRVTTTVEIGAVPGMPIAFFVLTILEPRTVRDTRTPLATLGTGEVVFREAPSQPVDNNPPVDETLTPAPPSEPPTQTPVNNDPPPPPVNNEGRMPAPAPAPEPVFSGSLVMAKVEFRYSNNREQAIRGCYRPKGPGENDGWHMELTYCSEIVARQENAKVSESYFLFPDTGLDSAYTITLSNFSMKRTKPTVVISVVAGGGAVNTIVHNTWSTISQLTNFYVPEFVTVTSDSVARASVTAFTANEFGRGEKTPYDFWVVGAHHIHRFCNWDFRAVNPFVSVSFRHWQSKVCPPAAGASPKHTPNKSDIASGALQDIGARGFGFADTPARFYARWGNKEKRKQAGFSYNFDTFALRTDYNKLPAAQDSGVMLDTYRVGVMPDIGKRHRLFAGVDNYRNGILAIQYTDAADTDTHTNIYKLGSVAGKGGYAVKFEWRIVWD